jgi:hypothetical protein
MGEVIDTRPDRFLREMRETGKWAEACDRSGMSNAEAEALCQSNPKFDLAQVECQLENHEEQLIAVAEQGVEKIRTVMKARVHEIRTNALAIYRLRHASVLKG